MGHSDGRRRPWTEGSEELLIGNIVIALFDLAAANQLDRLPLAIWRGDAEVHANAGRVIKLIDHIERLFFTGETDGWETTITPNTPDWSKPPQRNGVKLFRFKDVTLVTNKSIRTGIFLSKE